MIATRPVARVTGFYLLLLSFVLIRFGGNSPRIISTSSRINVAPRRLYLGLFDGFTPLYPLPGPWVPTSISPVPPGLHSQSESVTWTILNKSEGILKSERKRSNTPKSTRSDSRQKEFFNYPILVYLYLKYIYIIFISAFHHKIKIIPAPAAAIDPNIANCHNTNGKIQPEYSTYFLIN